MTTTMNGPQQEAVEHVAGPLVIFAGAGSGKTRVLTHRIANLIRTHGVSPSRILAVTFTRKAANEMTERVETLLDGEIDGLMVGTFHSVCVKILRKYATQVGRQRDFVIYDDKDQESLVKTLVRDEEILLKERQISWPSDLTIEGILSNIERSKRKLLRPDNISEQDASSSTFRRVWARYESALRNANAFDFADLIVESMHLAEREDEVGEWLRSRWDFVMVDEFQDTDEPQFRLVRALASTTQNICVVGDDDQCHPPGTMVLTSRSGEKKPIEELRDGDSVVAWDRSALRDGRKIKVGKRVYQGLMHTVVSSGNTVKATSNHRFVVRWADRKWDVSVVYMMWREAFGFRIGWCQLFNAEGALHLGQRARLEKADKVWVLGVFQSRTEASTYESIAIPMYGIPSITFEPAHGAQHMTADAIRQVFDALKEENHGRGLECLENHGYDFDLPFYPLPGKTWNTMGRTTLFECYAANLMPGLMLVPTVNRFGIAEWTTIEKNEPAEYKGTVYSLEVERDETYVANGVVAHNCIYTWRGAMPEYIRKFREFYPSVKVVKLEQNYRSTKRIVSSAVGVIERNTDSREPKQMFTGAPDGDHVMAVTCEDEREEAKFIAEMSKSRIQAGDKPKEIAILYRSHVMSRAIEEELRANDIKYKIHGGFKFFDRAEVRDAFAYLRLMVNPDSNVDLLRVINSPPRGIGPKTLGRVVDLAASKKVSLFSALDEAKTWAALGLKERQSIATFQALINDGRIASDEMPPSELVAGLMERSGMIRHWLDEAKKLGDKGKQDEAAKAITRSQNLQEMITDAVRFETRVKQEKGTPTLDAYVERITMLAEETDEEDAASVHMMTIHAAKGLEFDTVFMVGCEKGLFPSGKSKPGSVEDAEERRLMYVGITRAKKRLFLTRAESRFLYGKVMENKPSPYLDDMPDGSYVEVQAETLLAAEKHKRSA